MEKINERIMQLEALKMAIEQYANMAKIAAEDEYTDLQSQYEYIVSVLREKAIQLTK